jgi:hypothetical protein
VPVGAKGVGEAEAVQRQQDVGRQTLTEAFHRLATGFGDDDVESGLAAKADRRGQPGRSTTDDEDITIDGDQLSFSSSPRRRR